MSGEYILTNIVHRFGTNTRGNNCTNICTNRKQIQLTGNNCTTNLTTSVALRERAISPTGIQFGVKITKLYPILYTVDFTFTVFFLLEYLHNTKT